MRVIYYITIVPTMCSIHNILWRCILTTCFVNPNRLILKCYSLLYLTLNGLNPDHVETYEKHFKKIRYIIFLIRTTEC